MGTNRMGTRRRLVMIATLGAVTACSWFAPASPASARASRRADASTATTTTTTTTGLVPISGNYAFSGSVITGPGLAKPRTLNAYQSAVYVQSWLAGLYSGVPVTRQDPPATLPVYEVDVTGNWGGSIETRETFYASDGAHVWVAFPALQPIAHPPGTRPARIVGWFVALPRVKNAFAGTAKLVPTGGTQSATSTTTAATTTTAPVSQRSGGSDTAIGIVIVLAVVAAAGIALRLVKGRR